MPFTENLSEFFRPEDFAKAATYNAATINGIFRDEYEEDVEVEGSAPTFIARTSDLPNVAHGSELTIDSTVYTVRNVQKDGLGVTVLRLEEPA